MSGLLEYSSLLVSEKRAVSLIWVKASAKRLLMFQVGAGVYKISQEDGQAINHCGQHIKGHCLDDFTLERGRG